MFPGWAIHLCTIEFRFDSCMNQNPLNDKPRKEDDHPDSLAQALSG